MGWRMIAFDTTACVKKIRSYVFPLDLLSM